MSTKLEALPIVAYRIQVWSNASQSNNWALRFPHELPSLPIGFTELHYEGGLTDHTTATARISELEAEVERLRADAERYAYLRTAYWHNAILAVVIDPKTNVKLGSFCPVGEHLDAAIDQARRAQKGGA